MAQRIVQGVVGAQIGLFNPDAAVTAALRRQLRYPNPEYVRAQRGRGPVDDEIDPYLNAVDERADGSVWIPRGAIFELKMVLRARHVTLQLENERRKWPTLGLKPVEGLRDYQAEGSEAVRRLLQGMIVLPCGGGKTITGIGAMALVDQPTLVIVPTQDLLDQWCESLREFLGVEAAVFGAGKHHWGPVVVATKDALVYHLKHRAKAPDFFELADFGFVIVDESHSVAAQTHQFLMRHIPARYRLGLTATPNREDGGTPLVRWTFGDVLMERDVPALAEAGWLVLPRAEAIYTDFYFEMPEEPHFCDYTRLAGAVAKDAKRTARIVKLVAREPSESWLILSNRKSHCFYMEKLLREAGISAVAVTSDMKRKNERKNAIAAFRSGETSVMLATSLADQGLDIKRMTRCVLALPERAKGRTQQRVGRLMRPFGQKKAVLYDIVDHHVPTLLSRWQTRKSVYRSLGMEISECPTMSLFDRATP